ncbi:MAG: serine/threonine protein kinase [Alphaproteobacteria bacterium]|nr:serine/threonine protein kinase [Alphaproteobacteria bacterium]
MELVGRYRIERRIGEGAMADVYRAHDPSIDRIIAIKILKNEFRQNPEIATRFLREAKAAGALSHPNIVTIHDVGEVDGYPYIAMELLDGQPLDEIIRSNGKLPLPVVMRLGHQLAKALEYAHAQGVVHRDIKPSNIMISDNGRTAKILDFGIARMGEADRIRAEVNMLRTQVGQVLGTPRYMSPEQALGLEIDHRSDLFSLGVVLYEMITGRIAFGGSSMATIAIQITQQKPEPIAGIVRECPRGLQFIVEKLLAKQPERRFATGGELAAALRREKEALSAEAPSTKKWSSLPFRLTVLMGLVTAIALTMSISLVLNRQYQAMERMALTSGSSIASFVANNVSLRAVDNAGLPPAQQDWLPVQAFVGAASRDPNVQHITMVDAFGVIRGSSDPRDVGKRYASPSDETLVATAAQNVVTSLGNGKDEGFRFVRTISYAGQPFGKVDLVVGKADLKAAAASSRDLLLALGLVIFIAVLSVSYAVAQLLARPIRRLKRALVDAASGKLDFRISHNRTDEFGELFDGFNALAAALQSSAPRPGSSMEATSLDATRIDARAPSPALNPEPSSIVQRLRRRA